MFLATANLDYVRRLLLAHRAYVAVYSSKLGLSVQYMEDMSHYRHRSAAPQQYGSKRKRRKPSNPRYVRYAYCTLRILPTPPRLRASPCKEPKDSVLTRLP